MRKLLSDIHQVDAANENNYTPLWVAEIPDDWSQAILVTPEPITLSGRILDKSKWRVSDDDEQLEPGNESGTEEFQDIKAA